MRTEIAIPDLPKDIIGSEKNIWIMENWNYPLFFDKAVLELAVKIYDQSAMNMRHKEDPTWPRGPSAFTWVVRNLNGLCGGGLDDLQTRILHIWAEDDLTTHTITVQDGFRNKNETNLPSLKKFPAGAFFQEVQHHIHRREPQSGLIMLHDVTFETTRAHGQIFREVK